MTESNVDLWDLPGPSSFLRTLSADLSDRVSIAIHVPRHLPFGMLNRLRSRNEHYVRWVEIPAGEIKWLSRLQSCSEIQEYLGLSCTNGDISCLVQDIEDTVIWLHVERAAEWDVCRQFLDDFRRAVIQVDEYRRGVFGILVPGFLPMPDLDIGLAGHEWRGVVQELDIRLLVRQSTRGEQDFGPSQFLFESLIVELASFDLKLAQFLSEYGITELLTPNRVLDEYASSSGLFVDVEATWSNGLSDEFMGERRAHSIVALRDPQKREIKRRIWSAQLMVLFPYLERRRIEIAPSLARYIQFPVQGKYEMLHSVDDMELGELLHFLRGKRIPQALFTELEALCETRHQLAHLRTVDLAQLSNLLKRSKL